MNDAEEFVFRICSKSFLSLWSYLRPKSKKGKELCDILIVCEPDVIIFSVKEIIIKESGDENANWIRWKKRAIYESCKQIYGAERCLDGASIVIRNDGSPGLALPSRDERRIHRIAVAFGGKNKVPLIFGDFGKGFIHVFDETSFSIILKELDTISDFVSFLIQKEQLYQSDVKIINLSAEEDLLALYLHSGRIFPRGNTHYLITEPLWKKFISKPEYKKKLVADSASYMWDGLIEKVSEDVLAGRTEFGGTLNDSERALRIMAREDRFSRRILGKTFSEFYLYSKSIYRSRMIQSPSGILYVFLAVPHGTDRNYRVAELGTRSFIGRGLNPNCHTVIGIATEQYEPGKGFSLDLYYLYLPVWTKKQQACFEGMQKDLGFFTKSRQTKNHEDECPK